MTRTPIYLALVDGYNMLLRHPQWARHPLDEGRRQVLARAAQVRWPVPVARVRVIFDSRAPQSEGLAAATGPVSMEFASPTADAAIQAALRHAAHPERFVIVTDDREILDTAKAHRARCYGSRWFWAPAASPAARGGAPGAAEKADLPAASARAITEELARRWLKKPPPSAA